MHELSIAMSMIEAVQDEAQTRGVHVTAIHLKLGKLSGVVRQALEGSYEIAAAGTSLESARLIVQEVPVIAFCTACRERREVSSMLDLPCPACLHAPQEILQGKEVEVTALEVA